MISYDLLLLFEKGAWRKGNSNYCCFKPPCNEGTHFMSECQLISTCGMLQ